MNVTSPKIYHFVRNDKNIGPNSKLKLELKAFTLNYSFVTKVADFTGLGYDGIQAIYQQEQKKSSDQRALVIRYEEIKALRSLDKKYYAVTGRLLSFVNYTINGDTPCRLWYSTPVYQVHLVVIDILVIKIK